jgi:hypothetical protein
LNCKTIDSRQRWILLVAKDMKNIDTAAKVLKTYRWSIICGACC